MNKDTNLDKVSEYGIKVGKGGPGITVKRQHLLKVTAKVDTVDKSDGQLADLSLFVLHARGATR